MKITLTYDIDFDIKPYVEQGEFVEQKTVSRLSGVPRHDSSDFIANITEAINCEIRDQITIGKSNKIRKGDSFELIESVSPDKDFPFQLYTIYKCFDYCEGAVYIDEGTWISEGFCRKVHDIPY